ncbi:hypothetical protein BKA56DRAFT_155352 [Ilyonectria sp. MPI-CAGE-AT-0026]|nr:hypothetical protein BKA56DRAFT_155352 [Ilyonectria sp. MPI-CAGE-AT-0026]
MCWGRRSRFLTWSHIVTRCGQAGIMSTVLEWVCHIKYRSSCKNRSCRTLNVIALMAMALPWQPKEVRVIICIAFSSV